MRCCIDDRPRTTDTDRDHAHRWRILLAKDRTQAVDLQRLGLRGIISKDLKVRCDIVIDLLLDCFDFFS